VWRQRDGKKLALVKDGVSLQQLSMASTASVSARANLIGILQAIKAAGRVTGTSR